MSTFGEWIILENQVFEGIAFKSFNDSYFCLLGHRTNKRTRVLTKTHRVKVHVVSCLWVGNLAGIEVLRISLFFRISIPF